MDSAKKPLWLVFENMDEGAEDIYIIFKNGDGKQQCQISIHKVKWPEKSTF